MFTLTGVKFIKQETKKEYINNKTRDSKITITEK